MAGPGVAAPGSTRFRDVVSPGAHRAGPAQGIDPPLGTFGDRAELRSMISASGDAGASPGPSATRRTGGGVDDRLDGWTTGPEANCWRALYQEALASGDPELIAEGGALMRPVELMARATECLPAIALLMPGLVVCDGSDALERRVLADGRRLAGDLLAATGRALEAHAREVGYRPDEWITPRSSPRSSRTPPARSGGGRSSTTSRTPRTRSRRRSPQP